MVAGTNYFGEIISWKITTKFMERPGCVGYIFVKPGWNAIAKLTVVLMECFFSRQIFPITIERLQHKNSDNQ